MIMMIMMINSRKECITTDHGEYDIGASLMVMMSMMIGFMMIGFIIMMIMIINCR